MSTEPPDPNAMAAADEQRSAALFSLPLEIRLKVYRELWATAGLKQHIVSDSARLAATPCVCDQNGPDERMGAAQLGSEPERWGPRFKSDWCIHWPCEERMRGPMRSGQRLPFLPALLTCKRMHLECAESIADCVTFCFTDYGSATRFLSPAVRRVEICLGATNLLTEIYYYAPQGPDPHLPGQRGLTLTNNPWQRLCAVLAGLDRLRYLSVWLDSPDLRPWYRRVVESRFLAGLDAVRAGVFWLHLPGLPALPAVPPGDEDAAVAALNDVRLRPLGADAYLEGPNLVGRPYVVRRGWRPNRWLIHMRFDRGQI